MTLRKPPRKESSRLVGRLVALVLLLVLAGVAIWASVTIQQVDLVERARFRDIEHERPVEVGEITVNFRVDRQGEPMVVLLHDADVAGSIIWDDVVAALPEDYGIARVDLPGFGLTSRLGEPGPEHTVADMAGVVSQSVAEELGGPAIFAGVGFGGKVAGEVGVATPELVSGLALVDVDFWETGDWVEILEGLPWLGRAFTYSFETSGRFALERWAPHCQRGGWCPSLEQVDERRRRAEIEGTTGSIYGLARTESASQVPSRLDQVGVPVVFVHSTAGAVPAESVDRLVDEELPGMSVVEIDVWQAHLEAAGDVAAAIESLAG